MGRPLRRRGRVAFFAAVSAASFVHLFPGSTPAAAATPAEAIDDPSTLELTNLEGQFQAVAARVAPSVVAISAAATPIDDDDFVRSRRLTPRKLQDFLERTTRTVGSGFVVDAGGYVLTNQHVVEDSEQFWVTTDDGRVLPAVLVGSDPRQDLAVLKVPAKDLVPVKFADESRVRRGAWSIALGNPYGLAADGEMAVSVGVISALDRSLPKLSDQENRLYTDLIQTTAQINPGNSGGPLFDVAGEVVGVNAAVVLPQRQTNGIGFAIPAGAALRREVRDLEQGREIVYSYLGVRVARASEDERGGAAWAAGGGVRVESLDDDAPAAGALRPGDVLVGVNGQQVATAERFVRLAGGLPVETASVFRVVRDGKAVEVAVRPGKRAAQASAVTRETQRFHWRGLTLGPAAGASGLRVLAVADDSPMRARGVCVGSVVESVAGVPVNSVEQLLQIVNDAPPDRCVVQLAPTGGAMTVATRN